MPRGRKQKYEAGSVALLLGAYRASPEWRALAKSTRENYERYLRYLDRFGHDPVDKLRRRDIINLRDLVAKERGDGAATVFVKAVRSVMNWAVDREWIEHAPLDRVRTLPTGSIETWTVEEADRAERELPEHLRRVVILARYTGQRRSDLVAMRWTAYDGHAIAVKQVKTGAELAIAAHPRLRAELDAWPHVAPTILTTESGGPWAPNYLTRCMAAALRRLEMRPLNVHGIRKLFAVTAAEAGCTVNQIASVTGHKTLAMVQLYTAKADQRRLAEEAILRLQNGDELAP